METIKHLTQKQLLSYSRGWQKDEELRETGKHLLDCDVCLAALPEPTPEQFLKVLFTENDVNEQIEVENSESGKSFIRSLPLLSVLYKHPLSFAWGGGALILIISFSILIWFTASNQNQFEREVAVASFEKKETNFELKQNNQKNELIIDDTNSDKDQDSFEKPLNVSVSKKEVKKPILKKRNKPKRSEIIYKKASKKRDLSQNATNNIAATRGGSISKDKCDETVLGVKFQANDGKVVLKWKKYPEAVKYNLYISDDEEILIDEYETQDTTSYVLNKSLDPGKTYSWKILVTLENGKTIIGTSRKFTVKDFQMNEKNLKNKEKSDVRCAEKARTEK